VQSDELHQNTPFLFLYRSSSSCTLVGSHHFMMLGMVKNPDFWSHQSLEH